MPDPLMMLLADLSHASPDSARSTRVRRQCHSRLAGLPRTRYSIVSSRSRRVASGWAPFVAVLGVAYWAAALLQVVRTYRVP